MRRRVGPLLRFPSLVTNFSTDVELMRMLLISATFLLPLATFSPWGFQNTLGLEILGWLSKRKLAQKIEEFLPLRIPKHAGARNIGMVIKTKIGTENRGVMLDFVSSFLFLRFTPESCDRGEERFLIFWDAELQIFWRSFSLAVSNKN